MGLKLAPLTPELRRELHVPRAVKGVVVDRVARRRARSPSSGLAPGDVIQAINQEPVTTPKDGRPQARRGRKKSGKKTVLLLINRHGVNQYVALSMAGDDNG